MAPALRELLPILHARKKHIRVELMSELTPEMLTHFDIARAVNTTSVRGGRGVVIPNTGITAISPHLPDRAGIASSSSSGTRDVAVANTAEMAARSGTLAQLVTQAAGRKDFEALYEVYGVDRANVDTRLLITSALDTKAMWRN